MTFFPFFKLHEIMVCLIRDGVLDEARHFESKINCHLIDNKMGVVSEREKLR